MMEKNESTQVKNLNEKVISYPAPLNLLYYYVLTIIAFTVAILVLEVIALYQNYDFNSLWLITTVNSISIFISVIFLLFLMIMYTYCIILYQIVNLGWNVNFRFIYFIFHVLLFVNLSNSIFFKDVGMVDKNIIISLGILLPLCFIVVLQLTQINETSLEISRLLGLLIVSFLQNIFFSNFSIYFTIISSLALLWFSFFMPFFLEIIFTSFESAKIMERLFFTALGVKEFMAKLNAWKKTKVCSNIVFLCVIPLICVYYSIVNIYIIGLVIFMYFNVLYFIDYIYVFFLKRLSVLTRILLICDDSKFVKAVISLETALNNNLAFKQYRIAGYKLISTQIVIIKSQLRLWAEGLVAEFNNMLLNDHESITKIERDYMKSIITSLEDIKNSMTLGSDKEFRRVISELINRNNKTPNMEAIITVCCLAEENWNIIYGSLEREFKDEWCEFYSVLQTKAQGIEFSYFNVPQIYNAITRIII